MAKFDSASPKAKSQRFHAKVVEIVALKALWDNSEPQLSTAWPQRIQSKQLFTFDFN
jgi:hypothetical protein